MRPVYWLTSILWGLVALNHLWTFLFPDPDERGRRKRKTRSLIIASYPVGSVMLGAHLLGWRPHPVLWTFGVVSGGFVVGYHLVQRWERWRRRLAYADQVRESGDGEGLAERPPTPPGNADRFL